MYILLYNIYTKVRISFFPVRTLSRRHRQYIELYREYFDDCHIGEMIRLYVYVCTRMRTGYAYSLIHVYLSLRTTCAYAQNIKAVNVYKKSKTYRKKIKSFSFVCFVEAEKNAVRLFLK